MKMNWIVGRHQVLLVGFGRWGISYKINEANHRNHIASWFIMRIGFLCIEGWAP